MHGTFKIRHMPKANNQTDKEPAFRPQQKPSRTLYGHSNLHDEVDVVHLRPKP
jgi:hypothetical protein